MLPRAALKASPPPSQLKIRRGLLISLPLQVPFVLELRPGKLKGSQERLVYAGLPEFATRLLKF